MIPNQSFNVSSVQVSTLPIDLVQIEGYYRSSTANVWLQLHNSCIAPAAGAVPVWQSSGPLNGTAPFFEDFKTNRLGACTEGVFVGLSTTNGTYTADSTDKVDINVFTGVQVQAITVTGDKTTGVDSLAVYTDPNASKRLRAFIVSNSDATAIAPVYLQLFAHVPTANEVPLQEWTISGTSLVSYYTGTEGEIVMGQGTPLLAAGVVTTANYSLHTGCYLYGSSTAGYLTATTATHWTMLAQNI